MEKTEEERRKEARKIGERILRLLEQGTISDGFDILTITYFMWLEMSYAQHKELTKEILLSRLSKDLVFLTQEFIKMPLKKGDKTDISTMPKIVKMYEEEVDKKIYG